MDLLKNNIGLVVGTVLTLGVSAFLFMDASKRGGVVVKNGQATTKQIRQKGVLLGKKYPTKLKDEIIMKKYAITSLNEKLAITHGKQWQDAVLAVEDDLSTFSLQDSEPGLKPTDFSDRMIDSSTSMVKRLEKAEITLGGDIPLLSFGEFSGKTLAPEKIPVLNRRLQVANEIVRIAILSKVTVIDNITWPELVKIAEVESQPKAFSSSRRSRGGRSRRDSGKDEPKKEVSKVGTLSSIAKWMRLDVKVSGDQANVFTFMNELNKSKVIMAVVRDFKIEAPNEFKVTEPKAELQNEESSGGFNAEQVVSLKREDCLLDLQQTSSATLSIDIVEVKTK